MNNDNTNSPNEHIAVLTKALTERISLPGNAAVVDVTIGHGGHSYLFGKDLGPEGAILGLDCDEKSIQRARKTLSGLSCRVVLVRENFINLTSVARQEGIEKADLIIADLGFCSAQLSDSEKGLSFQENQPLDMRLDCRNQTTAADIVNSTSEKDLADLIYKFGQERASRRITRFIVQHRANSRITTTSQLAAIVCRALNAPATGRKSRIHPATKTFQAVRIAVNNELENLQGLLEQAPGLLKQGGYIAVISFHSLEDRIVKLNFKGNKQAGLYEIITKKPVEASREEIQHNPRARSAKLRIARRI